MKRMPWWAIPLAAIVGLILWMRRDSAGGSGSGSSSSGSGSSSSGSGTGATVQITDTKGSPIKTISVDADALEAYRNRKATREQLLKLGKPFIYEALANVYGPEYKAGLSASNYPGPFSESGAAFFLAAKTAAQADSGFKVEPYGSIGPFNTTTKRYGFAVSQMLKNGRPKILPVE